MPRNASRREQRVQAGLRAMEPTAAQDDGLYALLIAQERCLKRFSNR